MYYFAYGSSMNYEQMRRLCGWHFQLLGLGTLHNFEFGVDQRGYVNIRPKSGQKVIGVLYDLEPGCLDRLDEFEGYPQVFTRPEVEVVDSNNHKFKAWVYVEAPEQFGGKSIKLDYFKRFMAGAIDSKLPQDWINFLQSFEKITQGP